MTVKQLEQIALSIGAEKLEMNRDPDGTVEFCAVAPDGKQWVEGGCIHMSEVYWTYAPETRIEAMDTLVSRMKWGLEDLDEELNPQ